MNFHVSHSLAKNNNLLVVITKKNFVYHDINYQKRSICEIQTIHKFWLVDWLS